MDRLAEMEAFTAVVDQGGFTGAARKLGLSKSAISKHVAALEARLGATLLNRTTRKVNATELGLEYYDRARRILKESEEADAFVTSMQGSPKGELRISAPVSLGAGQLSAAIGEFLKTYPDISVHLVLDDKFVELVSEGFDMAIRIGQMEDSSLRARKLAESPSHLVAAPSYLEERGTPQCLEDLANHELLHYSHLSTGNFWRVTTRTGAEKLIRVGGRVTANNGEALLRIAEAGIGITRVPAFILGDAIKSGRVVEVLPEQEFEALGIFAIYPPGPYPQPKLRLFLDFMVAYFKRPENENWS